jgi:hypothetical protein
MPTGFIFRLKAFDVEELASLSIAWRVICFHNVGDDDAPADTKVFSRNRGAEDAHLKPAPALVCLSFRDSIGLILIDPDNLLLYTVTLVQSHMRVQLRMTSDQGSHDNAFHS